MAPKRTTANQTSAYPRRVVISPKETAIGTLKLDNVQVGVEEFQTQGFVILENAVDQHSIGKLHNQILKDSATPREFPELGFNHGMEDTNFSITPPLSDEFLIEEVWANKHAIAIIEQLIGPKPVLCWAASNIALPGKADARQAVHSDAYADIPGFPFCVEMTVYLQDATLDNGATEIWPGTHVFTEDDHLPHGRGWINKNAFTYRARTCPPIQPAIRRGSIMLRDLRLWHSDMPNTSPDPCITMKFLYFPRWFRPDMRITLPEFVRPKVESWTFVDLKSNTSFLAYIINHLILRFPTNFTQDPENGLVAYRTAVDRRQGRAPNARIEVTKDNYWKPSKYWTRAAAGKRKRQEQGEGDDGVVVKKQKRGVEAEVKKEPGKRKRQEEEEDDELVKKKPKREEGSKVQKEPEIKIKQEHEEMALWALQETEQQQETKTTEVIEDPGLIEIKLEPELEAEKETEFKIKQEEDVDRRFDGDYEARKEAEVKIKQEEETKADVKIKQEDTKQWPDAGHEQESKPKPVKRSPLGLSDPITNDDISSIDLWPPSGKAQSPPALPPQPIERSYKPSPSSPPSPSPPPPRDPRFPPCLHLLGRSLSLDGRADPNSTDEDEDEE